MEAHTTVNVHVHVLKGVSGKHTYVWVSHQLLQIRLGLVRCDQKIPMSCQ